MARNSLKFVFAAFVAASLAITAGCGSGGSSSSSATPIDPPLMPGANTTAGPADPIQDVLDQLVGTLNGLPVLGETAGALVGSLVSLLDAPDGLASGFQDFLLTQDPQQLINGGQASGDAILAFAAGVSETLIQLTEEGAAIPGSDAALTSLLNLQTLVQNGFTGASQGGDLTILTNALADVAGNLSLLGEQVPAGVQDAPLIGALFAALSQGSQDLVTIIDATGQLDGEATSNALVASFENVLNALAGALPGGFELPLEGAVGDSIETFSGGLALLLDPLFQSLSAVLAPITGGDAPLNNILPSLFTGNLAGLGSIGGLSGLSDLLAGGGTDANGLPIPVLGDLLAGLPLLGDLLGGLPATDLPGASAGGLPLLGDVLSGSNNLPLLGDLLQGLPGLSGPGGGAASLPLLGDLLTTLLSLGDGGVPVIGDILAAGEGANGLDIPVIGGILDGLLGNLLGMAGGVDATGGFLDGLGGIPVLGDILGGLLGGLLGQA